MIRLYRILPLLVILAIIAGVIYLVMTWRYSSNKAKEVLIRLFTWITLVLSIFFAVVTAYAAFERNMPVVELTGSCLVLVLVGLGITRICNRVFRKHHPNFKVVTAKANVVNESLTARFSAALRKALKEALRETFSSKRK